MNDLFSDGETGRGTKRLTLTLRTIRWNIQSKKLMVAIGARALFFG